MPELPTQPTYCLENGMYVFYANGEKLFETPEVSLLFDKTLGTLHKHGAPEVVATAYRRFYTALHKARQSPEYLVMITGHYDVKALNKVVQGSDCIGAFYDSLLMALESVALEQVSALMTKVSSPTYFSD